MEEKPEETNETPTNIIQFPNVAVRPLPIKTPNKEAVDQHVEQVKHYHVARTLAEIGPQILSNMEVAGIHVGSDPDMTPKDGAFLMESLRAFMYRYYKLFHPFHTVTDNIFVDQEDGSMKLADKLDIEIPKKKAVNE